MPRPQLPSSAHDIGANERKIIKKWWAGAPLVSLDAFSNPWLAAHTWECAEPKECRLCAKWRRLDEVAVAMSDDDKAALEAVVAANPQDHPPTPKRRM
jgi:hypothetical protein